MERKSGPFLKLCKHRILFGLVATLVVLVACLCSTKSKGHACTIEAVIFRMGYPGHFYGTSFVISAKERLLVTNAHIADIKYEAGNLYAIPVASCACDTLPMFKVEQIWYHPNLKRLLDDFILESTDPADGLPVTPSLDVAIVKLAEGPYVLQNELVVEVFSTEELNKLHDITFTDVINEKNERFQDVNKAKKSVLGGVSNVTDLDFASAAKLLRTNLPGVEGNSGSPYVIEKTGHVLGVLTWLSDVHNNTKVDKAECQKKPSAGLSSHAIVEIMHYYGLNIPYIGKKQSFKYRNRTTSEEIELARTAYAYKKRGIKFVEDKNYVDGLRSFDKALEIVPNYASAYREKAKVLHTVKVNNKKVLTFNQLVKINGMISQCIANALRFGGPQWKSIKVIEITFPELYYVSYVMPFSSASKLWRMLFTCRR